MALGQKKYVLRPKDTPVRIQTKQRPFSGPSGALTRDRRPLNYTLLERWDQTLNDYVWPTFLD